MNPDPITDAALRVFVVLRSARERHDCLLPSEIAVLAALPRQEASDLCHELWHKGIVARYGGYPDHRYRLLGNCMQVEQQAYYEALLAACQEAVI